MKLKREQNFLKHDILRKNICKNCEKWENSILILVCLKLGENFVHPDYFNSIIYLMDIKFSLGILGIIILS